MNDKQNIPGYEDKQIDDLFRNSLGNYTIESADNHWKGISRKLLWKEIAHLNFTNVSKVSWIAGGATIAVIIGLLFFYPGKKSAILTNPDKYKEATTEITTGNGNISIGNNTTQNNSKDNTTKSIVGQPSLKPVSGKPVTTYSVIHKPLISNQKQTIASNNYGPATNSVNSSNVTNIPSAPYSDFSNLTLPSERWSIQLINSLGIPELNMFDFRDTIISFHTPKGIVTVQKQKLRDTSVFFSRFWCHAGIHKI